MILGKYFWGEGANLCMWYFVQDTEIFNGRVWRTMIFAGDCYRCAALRVLFL